MQKSTNSRMGAIGLLKFVASLFIVWRHMRYVIGHADYPFNSSYIFVELFLMITGFFIYKKSLTSPKLSINDSVSHILRSTIYKYKKILPTIIIGVIFAYGIAFVESTSLENSFQLATEIPFSILPLSSFVRSQNVPLWYISAYFLILPFFQILCDIVSHRRGGKILLPFVLIASIIYYCLMPVPYTSGLACLVRCFFALCLGIIIYYLVESFQKSRLRPIIFTIVECFSFLAIILLIYPRPINSISGTIATPLAVLLFIILLASLFSQRSFFAKLNGRWCNFLEELSTTIFLLHFPIVKFMGTYLPATMATLPKIALTYLAVLICAILSRKIVDDILSVYGK